MKVIQIMDNFITGGGVNSFVYDLCYALNEYGFDVSLIGIMNLGYEDNPIISQMRELGIRVECIGANTKKNAILHYVGKLKKLIKILSEGEQTVCNLHLKLGVLMGVLATRGMKNVKRVETYHNSYHHYRLQCWALRPFIKKYICVSETAHQEMIRRFNLPNYNIVSIPNGISRDRIRHISGIDQPSTPVKSKVHIVSVGRISYEKNFKVPVKAFTKMCNKEITYTLVGGGPQEKEIKNIASDNPYIKVLGVQSRVCALQELAKADLVVLPSLWEGRSILQLEAMALDKPMMISDVPGLREPFGENELEETEAFRVCSFGYLVRTNDVDSYKQALNHYIAHIELHDTIKTYIKGVSLTNDISIVAEKYVEIYRSIL